jgi:hypothetical protein
LPTKPLRPERRYTEKYNRNLCVLCAFVGEIKKLPAKPLRPERRYNEKYNKPFAYFVPLWDIFYMSYILLLNLSK